MYKSSNHTSYTTGPFKNIKFARENCIFCKTYVEIPTVCLFFAFLPFLKSDPGQRPPPLIIGPYIPSLEFLQSRPGHHFLLLSGFMQELLQQGRVQYCCLHLLSRPLFEVYRDSRMIGSLGVPRDPESA